MFKVNNRKTRTSCKIYLNLTIHQNDIIDDTLFTPCISVSIANFEQVNAGWAVEGCLKDT